MKKLSLIVATVLLFAVVPLFAQEHAEVGVYADYLNLHHAGRGFWGVGGRVGFHIAPHTVLEGGLAYDFAQGFTGTDSAGFTTNTNLTLLHGTFGPKFYADMGAFRPFVFAKGGFLNFRANNGATTASDFTNQLGSFVNGDTNGVFYPGVGFEIHGGHFGLRAEAGDYMYFDRGANHNIRVTVGPVFTF